MCIFLVVFNRLEIAMNVLFCMNVPVVAILMLNSPRVRLWHQFWTEENKLCFPEVAWEYFNYQRLGTALLRCFFVCWPDMLAAESLSAWQEFCLWNRGEKGRWLPSSGRHSLERLKLWEILDITSFGERTISQQVSFSYYTRWIHANPPNTLRFPKRRCSPCFTDCRWLWIYA